jgi:hypothetical protein
MSVMSGGLDGRRSVRRQLACSLVAFETWAAVNALEAEELRDLFEHMWKRGSIIFEQWQPIDSPYRSTTIGMVSTRDLDPEAVAPARR